MKIFEIGTGYTSIPAKMGAATEIVVEELTNSMLKQGADVEIVDIKDTRRAKTFLPINEVFLPEFFSSSFVVKLGLVHKIKRVLYSIALTRKLHKLIQNVPKDEKIVLHFHNQYNLFFFLKLTSRKLRQRCVIAYTVHSYIWFGDYQKIKNIITKRYFQEVFCCRNADKVFVLNDIVKEMLVTHYGVNTNNIVNVINGVNTDVFNDNNFTKEYLEQLRANYGLVGKKVILQVGSVCDRKNQLGTLELLTPLMKNDQSIVYAYAGGIIDNKYQGHIGEYAQLFGVENRVKYLGEVIPGKQLAALYAMVDVCILNSKSESFALVVAEALSSARPIFICDSIMDSLHFWGENEGRGIIRISNTFYDDFKRLIEDNVYYEKMKTLGRQFIEEEYSWDVAAKQYLLSF